MINGTPQYKVQVLFCEGHDQKTTSTLSSGVNQRFFGTPQYKVQVLEKFHDSTSSMKYDDYWHSIKYKCLVTKSATSNFLTKIHYYVGTPTTIPLVEYATI